MNHFRCLNKTTNVPIPPPFIVWVRCGHHFSKVPWVNATVQPGLRSTGPDQCFSNFNVHSYCPGSGWNAAFDSEDPGRGPGMGVSDKYPSATDADDTGALTQNTRRDALTQNTRRESSSPWGFVREGVPWAPKLPDSVSVLYSDLLMTFMNPKFWEPLF